MKAGSVPCYEGLVGSVGDDRDGKGSLGLCNKANGAVVAGIDAPVPLESWWDGFGIGQNEDGVGHRRGRAFLATSNQH